MESNTTFRLPPRALAGNLVAVSKWNARSEVPDVVAYADLRYFAEEVAEQWAAQVEPDPIGQFAYPKRGGGIRQISILSVRDIVRLRTAVGDIARVTNEIVLPTVYSAKLRAQPPTWYFKNNLYAAFQQAALRLCRYWESDGMVRTDVQAYYPSIQIEDLFRALWNVGCDREAVRLVVQVLMRWQDRDHLSGIPIGQEACAVLGAFYLRDFDRAIAPLTTGFFRYSDDVIYFFKEDVLGDGGLSLVKGHLQDARLAMNEHKTRVFYDPAEAAEAIRRSLLDYVEDQFQDGGEGDQSVIQELFDEEIATNPHPDPVTYAWCLNRLMRGRPANEHALATILNRPELMSLDPRITSEYLTKCACGNSDAISAMAARLPLIKGEPGAALHTLRYLAASGVNQAQADAILGIAVDPSVLSPVRAWAMEAHAGSPRFNLGDLADCVDADTPELVRRGAVLALRRRPGHRGRRFVARQLASRFPDTRWSAMWAAEIAA